mmetsp:Transcript_13179/g.24665  ORF Transcript_13179/g.24665 Transcript_13179/m.24665 type:complete len:272 (+) Transcript_13179:1816-2631(+)
MGCAVCLHPYSESRKPLFLPCGHTFCSVCIGDLSKRSKAVCPNCTRSFSSEELPVNYSLLEVEEVKAKPVEHLSCPRHAHKKAKFYCRPCKIVFCSDCFSLHKAHQPEPLSEYVQQDVQARLPTLHAEERIVTAYANQVASLKTKADYNLKKVTQAITAQYEAALKAINDKLQLSLQEVHAIQDLNQVNYDKVQESVDYKLKILHQQDKLLNEALTSEGAEQVEKWMSAVKIEDTNKMLEFEQTLLTYNYEGALDSATLSISPEEIVKRPA